MKWNTRLRAGESSGIYRPGQFVSAGYAGRYPDKVVRPPLPPPPPPPEGEADEWEITTKYEEYEG